MEGSGCGILKSLLQHCMD